MDEASAYIPRHWQPWHIVTKGSPGEASFHTGRAKILEDDPTVTFTATLPFAANASYGVFGGLESRRRSNKIPAAADNVGGTIPSPLT
jgi:hypothetical protein